MTSNGGCRPGTDGQLGTQVEGYKIVKDGTEALDAMKDELKASHVDVGFDVADIMKLAANQVNIEMGREPRLM